MRQTKNAGLLVEEYVHEPTGDKFEIRYVKASKKHVCQFNEQLLEDVSFDVVKAKLVELCAKRENIVWTPAIEFSAPANGNHMHYGWQAAIRRCYLAIREDGQMMTSDWDVQVPNSAGRATWKLVPHAEVTDAMRSKHARVYPNPQADAIMSALAEGKPYRVLNSQFRHDGRYEPVPGDYSPRLTWLPYHNALWNELQKLPKLAEKFSDALLLLVSDEASLSTIKQGGLRPVTLYP